MDEEKRICSECGKEMTEGYCIHDGEWYYCSDECLHKNITKEEYMDLYNNDEAYWTIWDEGDLYEKVKTLEKDISNLKQTIGIMERTHRSDMEFVNAQIDCIADHLGINLADFDLIKGKDLQ